MTGPVFTNEDFAQAILKLLPRGPAWPRDQDSVQKEVAEALAPTMTRNSAAALGLAIDNPAFILDQMLPEWEATLGLPDPCAGPAQSIQQRVAQVVAKLSLPGGQSAAYFIALAAKLGYANCTVTNYAPFRADRSHAGDPAAGPDWAHVWTLFAPELSVFYFSADVSVAGDPLYDLGGDELKCTVGRYAPAHTIPLFAGNA